MNTVVALVAASLIALSQAACAGTRAYAPLQASLDVPSTLRAQAIQEFVLDEDLYVVQRNSQWTFVEVTSRPKRSRHGVTRDRIRIDSRKPSVEISLWTELRSREGQWLRSSDVCGEYSHSREQEVARALRHRIRRYLFL